MPEKTRYPQIPSTVWWGVRAILQKTPTTTLDDRYLSVHLNVQPAAAKQYLAELMSIGILTDDGKATPLALKWRLNQTYADAVETLVSTVYPDGLRSLAPPQEGDRNKAINWFEHEGLGRGAAGNKAATYLMIGSPKPGESPAKVSSLKNNSESRTSPGFRAAKKDATAKAQTATAARVGESSSGTSHTPGMMPLNVNIQIHIAADAANEQIESIFSAMRRYLYDQQAG